LKNVFCVGRNYAAHAAEGARAAGREVVVPEVPEFFTKPPTAVTGHNSAVPVDPRVTQKFDYEVELAVVIGTAGKDIPRERALDHVFGFTIVNDLTARDLQRRHGQWFKGKGLDLSCPMGPWIVTRDALPNFADLAITLRVNGETRQKSRTSKMVHDIPAIIEHLSRGMTLEPGDVIATGTPEGVGYAMDPPRFLAAGDVVEAEIEGIGVLRTPIA
jgi:2-keto-4-pentenoate hydratase/2-oxohepta-3-ene-1,7-dioic acid hydratase in catechol pathway